MSDEAEEISTAQHRAFAAGEQALAVRHRQLTEEETAWEEEVTRKHAQMVAFKEKVEEDRLASSQEQANNWQEEDTLKSEQDQVKLEYALVKRDKVSLEDARRKQQQREEERRKRRTNSMVFVEDSFALQTARDVIGCLTHPSVRIKRQAMNNISFCINGSVEMPQSFVHFKAEDIATILLPKLHDILSVDVGPSAPTDIQKQFAEEIVASPTMARALALNGQCRVLAKYLIHRNEVINRLAICSFRQMIKLDSAVVKNAYEALDDIISQIWETDSASTICHPSVEFFVEIAPKVVVDYLGNNHFDKILPFLGHKIAPIRQSTLPKVVHEARSSDRIQSGLVEAHILRVLQGYIDKPQPPPEILEFLAAILPVITQKLCRNFDDVNWLIERLANPNTKVLLPIIEALRSSSRKEDSIVHDTFVQADILYRLNNPPTQGSPDILKLICDLLPILAVPHTRNKTCSRIVPFLDHGDIHVTQACITGCKKIADSTPEDRAGLFRELRKLDLARESTLELLDYILPLVCKDWTSAGKITNITRMLTHLEPRVRVHAHRAWREILLNTPEARANVSIDTVFRLCSSAQGDCVNLGQEILPTMAVEIAKGGVAGVSSLLNLLHSPRTEMRQSALRAIQKITDSGSENCEILRTAGTFSALKHNLIAQPLDGPDTIQSILINMVPHLSKSDEACRGLLELLNSTVPQVEKVVLVVLVGISNRNTAFRQTLRNAVLESLVQISDSVIQYSAKAIRDWVGPDLVVSNEFAKLIQLVFHTDRRIQAEVIFTLRQTITNAKYQEALVKEGIVPAIQTLSTDNSSDVIGFVILALRSLALILVRRGHTADILRFLSSDVIRLREGAYVAIEIIAKASEVDKKVLVDEDIIERVTGDYGEMSQASLKLAETLIKRLTPDYVRVGKVHMLIPLVDHKQEPIRQAVKKSLKAIAGGAEQERNALRLTLLPLIGGASPSLLDVAAVCLRQSFAHDLVVNCDFGPLFELLENENACMRAPVIAELESYIQSSNIAGRRTLIDAGILNAMLHALIDANTTEDLLSFLVQCVLPELGPSFTQSDGGAAIIPLLGHDEPSVRAGAATAIRNAVESRHGNLENLANSRVTSILHSAIEDDNIRDLWCYILPKIARFLTYRDEIDILFGCLSGRLDSVRQAASEALDILARTSDETRLHLFPSLLARIDGPAPASIRQISQAVSRSGFTFAFHGKEPELLGLIQHCEPPLSDAAIDAVTDLLSKGESSERQALFQADIVRVAGKLYMARSSRRSSLKLLNLIIKHLIHQILSDEELTTQLLHLFDDPDAALSQVLFDSLKSVPDVSSSTLPQAIHVLLDPDRQKKPFVPKLLCALAPQMVNQLLALSKVDIIVKLLGSEDINISTTYLDKTLHVLNQSTSGQKDLLSEEPHFAIVLGCALKSRNLKKRRIASEIITVITEGSAPRSAKLLQERGIIVSLARISMEGTGATEASNAGLTALKTIFMTSPDHAEQVSSDSIPALCDVLNDVHRSMDSYMIAFGFLKEVVRQFPDVTVIGTDIVVCLADWLSPQHSVTDIPCRNDTFYICQLIAQRSDSGRRALLDQNILPLLVKMSADTRAENLIGACTVLLALARSGTFKAEMSAAGVRSAMERITSPFMKSTLSNKADKKRAQELAKGVLAALQDQSTRLSRNRLPVGGIPSVPQKAAGAERLAQPRVTRSASDDAGAGQRPAWVSYHPRTATDEPLDRMPGIREGYNNSNIEIFNVSHMGD